MTQEEATSLLEVASRVACALTAALDLYERDESFTADYLLHRLQINADVRKLRAYMIERPLPRRHDT